MTDLKGKLRKHRLWLKDKPGGERFVASGCDLRYVKMSGANLRYANLRYGNLSGADLRGCDLSGCDLSYANLRDTDLRDANLRDADLFDTNLSGSDMSGVNLSGADMSGASLSGCDLIGCDLTSANLRCYGDMKHIKTMQIDTWAIGYTHDTLQIGCERHAIDKWRKWDTEAGRAWIAAMDSKALEWADRNLALVLQIIDANPALPTDGETND